MEKLNIKIFADGADKAGMLEMAKNPMISGFTTNPTLMRKAGVKDYKVFAQDILSEIKDKPISLRFFRMSLMKWKVRPLKYHPGETTFM